jgi:hypothetical protein
LRHHDREGQAARTRIRGQVQQKETRVSRLHSPERSHAAGGRRIGLRLAGVVGALAIGCVLALLQRAPAAAQSESPIYLPASLKRAGFPRVSPPTTVAPSNTPFSTVAPTSTGPTPTRTPENTITPTPRPTTGGGHVGHPDGSEIIFQIGYTESDEISETWEEMNGTPYFTLYGDGRVIIQQAIPDAEKDLFEGRVDEETVQTWLQEMVYGVRIYNIADDADLGHPGSLGKPVLHVYVNTTGGGGKRMRIPGFIHWRQREVREHPFNASIQRLMGLMRELDTWAETEATVPFEPESYTLIVQWAWPELLTTAPPWEGPSVRHIAFAAPTAQSNYENHVPGHKTLDSEQGPEYEALVRPEWERSWVIYNVAAEFKLGSEYFDIGVRREVPGGSMFLPDVTRRDWYRRDVGAAPGVPSLLDPRHWDALPDRWFRRTGLFYPARLETALLRG